MNDGPVELKVILNEVRRRWTRRSWLRAWTLGAAASATIVFVGLVASTLVARDGIPLVFTSALVLCMAGFALARALWPCRRIPTDRQFARYIEERADDLDDVVVTAVDYLARAESSPPLRDRLAADAARALSALDLDTIVSRDSVRQAALRAAAAGAVLAVAAGLFTPAVFRSTNVASAYLFPARLEIDVTPGTTKLRAGLPITITARVAGSAGELVPALIVAVGDETREIRMTPGPDPGTFSVTIDNVNSSFAYRVTAAAARSDDHIVTVIRPPRVERIDLHYDFPRGLGLEPRTDEDSGDIYGPAGTSVRLTITADKPITSAFLLLDDGTRVPLNGHEQMLDGALRIDDDGSYRIALADEDGLENPGETEYFIRTLDDRPPDVRILRPASDRKVTPLEEVVIEARADDDYGIASFDLVFQSATGKERAVPLQATKGELTASALHTLFMEDLGVQPGDFVTYYARARDVNRGRRTAEARSDIFFLEVKPFEEEFVAAQSQSMGQGGGGQRSGLQELAEAQKEIYVATWKLDARGRRARDAGSEQDIQAVSKAQSELRIRTEAASAQAQRMGGDPRRRRGGQGPAPGDDPLGKAVEAMDRAVNELDEVRTTSALPHEMEALNELLKADADVRRRQVARQQQAGGGGGMNRSEADLSNLFDQELRKRQETNYETPNSTEERPETKQEDPLERIRDLARRQDALNRQQRDLMRNREQLDQAELKRQLERLTREQNDLRQQAEQLAERMQQQGSRQQDQSGQSQSGQSEIGQQKAGASSGQGSGSGQQDSRRLREISEDMRNAATGMRRQDSDQASESGTRASDRLRDLEKQLQTSRPDDRRRALGDLQLETRQLADAQRRLANEASRTAQGQPGDDARRRLAGEQERLADRAERLQEQVSRISRADKGEGDERNATHEAARELEGQKLADKMRESAEALRRSDGAHQGQEPDAEGSRQAARQGEDVARALDRIADRLSAATGAQDADSQRLSDSLAKTQELRDQVSKLERSIEQLQRQEQQSQAGQPSGKGREPSQEQESPQSSAPEGSAGQQAGSAGANGGRMQQLQREVNEGMRAAGQLAEEIRRENPGMQANNQEGWWRSFSAPGTEAFKQDFARWESLKNNLLVALEGVESKVSGELRARENKERFNAGGHDAVGEAYRDLVDKYYRSLAAPRTPQ